jgi:hypothetical protein
MTLSSYLYVLVALFTCLRRSLYLVHPLPWLQLGYIPELEVHVSRGFQGSHWRWGYPRRNLSWPLLTWRSSVIWFRCRVRWLIRAAGDSSPTDFDRPAVADVEGMLLLLEMVNGGRSSTTRASGSFLSWSSSTSIPLEWCPRPRRALLWRDPCFNNSRRRPAMMPQPPRFEWNQSTGSRQDWALTPVLFFLW